MSRYTRIEEFATQYMYQEGSTANKNANINAAGAVVNWVFAPATGTAFIVRRIIIYGLGSANVSNENYIDLTALTNGYLITLNDGTGLISDITDGVPVKSNDGIARLCFDAHQNLFGANNKSVVGRYTLSNDTGDDGVLIDGTKGQKLVIPLNDNFSTLTEHYFRVGAKQINI